MTERRQQLENQSHHVVEPEQQPGKLSAARSWGVVCNTSTYISFASGDTTAPGSKRDESPPSSMSPRAAGSSLVVMDIAGYYPILSLLVNRRLVARIGSATSPLSFCFSREEGKSTQGVPVDSRKN